jgi:hypothetical protein
MFSRLETDTSIPLEPMSMSVTPQKMHRAEACQFVPCSPTTLYLASKAGKLTRAYDSDRRLVFDLVELQAFKAEFSTRKRGPKKGYRQRCAV